MPSPVCTKSLFILTKVPVSSNIGGTWYWNLFFQKVGVPLASWKQWGCVMCNILGWVAWAEHNVLCRNADDSHPDGLCILTTAVHLTVKVCMDKAALQAWQQILLYGSGKSVRTERWLRKSSDNTFYSLTRIFDIKILGFISKILFWCSYIKFWSH